MISTYKGRRPDVVHMSNDRLDQFWDGEDDVLVLLELQEPHEFPDLSDADLMLYDLTIREDEAHWDKVQEMVERKGRKGRRR